MKRTLLSLAIALFGISLLVVNPVRAQAETPPTGSTGEIHGSVINTNSGNAVEESMDVMLHILDQNYADMNMLHGKSDLDGNFVFADVPFASDLRFAVMATFDGVTYSSKPVPADMASLSVSIDVPVYETTQNLEDVQVEQMHVLFELSSDGLETKELYIVSNTGERTVKDAFDLGEGKFATLQFPLPLDADYVFFKPDDANRFIKLKGRFADTDALIPGGRPSQLMVSYLVPFSGERTYSYTAPMNVAQINLVVPEDAGLSVDGAGLTGPKSMTLQDGLSYQVYTYSPLNAGQTLKVAFTGSPLSTANKETKNKNLFAFVAAFLGFAVIGAGIWWWRKSEGELEEDTPYPGRSTFDDLITEIVSLDESYEEQGLNLEEYQNQRRELMQKAKSLS